MPVDPLTKGWQAQRGAAVAIDPVMSFSDRGLVLGAATVLAAGGVSGRAISVDDLEPRLSALLAAAHLHRPDHRALAHLRKAAQRWNEGNDALASMHLALSGLDRLARPAIDARRLVLADALLEAGLQPEALYRALGIGCAAPDALDKQYDPTQPRVPAGSGRPSGQWTATGAGAATQAPPAAGSASRAGRRSAAARQAKAPAAKPAPPPARVQAEPPAAANLSAPSHGVSAAAVAAAGATIGARAGASLDLGVLSASALAQLATFVGALAPSASAAATAVVGGIGLSLVPSSIGQEDSWEKVPGPGDVSMMRSHTTLEVFFRYTTRDGVRRSLTTTLGPNGEYRDPEGRTIARAVRTGTTINMIVSTAALLDTDHEDGQLCPAPVKDNGGDRGQRYENPMKRWFNPRNPTPPGMAYKFFNPITGEGWKIDDCKQETEGGVEEGTLAEYKGFVYEEKFLKQDIVWREMYKEMMQQSSRHLAVKGDRRLIWYFQGRNVSDYIRDVFKKQRPGIEVVWHPI